MDGKPSEAVFDLPWSLLMLEANGEEPGVFRRGSVREDIQEWLDEHAPGRYRIEGGVFSSRTTTIKTRHFRLHFTDERDAVHFRLRWGEETRLNRPGESFTVHIWAPD